MKTKTLIIGAIVIVGAVVLYNKFYKTEDAEKEVEALDEASADKLS